MIRFFIPEVSPAIRAFLQSNGIRFEEIPEPRPIIRFALDPRQIVIFRSAEGEPTPPRIFHDIAFEPPKLVGHYAGADALGAQVRDNLARYHTLGGADALIIIMDSGVDVAGLKRCGFAVDEQIHMPGVTASMNVTHGTMCALDALLAAPAATIGSLQVSANATTIASDLYEGFSALLDMRPQLDAYKALVVSISLQIPLPEINKELEPGSLIPESAKLLGNPDHPTWTQLTAITRKQFDVLIAAGNDGCGASSMIQGLARHPHALTVGAVDPQGAIDARSSCDTTGIGKPDFTTYANFLWSELYGMGALDAGTSTSTALGAGLVASARIARGVDKYTLAPIDLVTHIRQWVRPGPGQQPQMFHRNYGWGVL